MLSEWDSHSSLAGTWFTASWLYLVCIRREEKEAHGWRWTEDPRLSSSQMETAQEDLESHPACLLFSHCTFFMLLTCKLKMWHLSHSWCSHQCCRGHRGRADVLIKCIRGQRKISMRPIFLFLRRKKKTNCYFYLLFSLVLTSPQSLCWPRFLCYF